jgi:hypothetical protein
MNKPRVLYRIGAERWTGKYYVRAVKHVVKRGDVHSAALYSGVPVPFTSADNASAITLSRSFAACW